MNLDRDLFPGVCFSSTLTYTGKMIVPYFGPLAVDPAEKNLYWQG